MEHNKASLLDHKEVAKFLETDHERGLAQLEAQQRLTRFGRNRLDGAHEKPATRAQLLIQKYLAGQLLGQFLRQFLNPLIQLLLICALISACIGQFESSVSVLVAVLIVCTISHVQERRADASLEKLNRQMPHTCQVMRDGQLLELEAELLVPGDLVRLSEGQRVPADIRLFEVHSLTINESNLTGEPQSQCKQSERQVLEAELGSGVGPRQASLLSLPLERPDALLAIDMPAGSTENGGGGGGQQQENAGELVHQNLALMGTLVESGRSSGLVFATGKSTRYGQVFSMLKSAQRPKSPLQANIEQLSLHLVVVACIIIALTSIVGIVQRRAALEVTFYAISLAVTAIPEGLPVVVAVIMALGVMRLSEHKTIVRSPNSIETLGCLEVLCSDKTGTLTRNDMTLTDIVTSELHSLSSGELAELNQEQCIKQMTFNKFGGKMYSIGRLMEVGTLCNNAQLERNCTRPSPGAATSAAAAAAATSEPRVTHPDDSLSTEASSCETAPASMAPGHYRLVGQATECAILEAALRLGFGDSRAKFERLHETPFSSSSRRMVVQCRRRDLPSRGPMFYVKGAWEEILQDCGHYYECGLVKPRNEEMWREYARISTALGSQGLRVLALATGPAQDQLTFVGLVGISNSLRDGMAGTVRKLREKFHIDFKMITGDSRATALAVARSLGLVSGPAGSLAEPKLADDKQAMSGDQLQRLLSTDLDQATKARQIMSRNVFYRVDPVQKANIVSKLQELNKVVGMTGDGVNDIISLKRANLSLVMGSGADVCKEIADVIMVEDDLSVLAEAVLEGKGIYHKIHSFLSYQISISLAIVLLVAIAFACECEPPFSVSQLLYINILADGPPAQSLGLERPSENELCLWPRNVNEPLLSCRLLGTLLILTLGLLALNGALYDYLLDPAGRLDGHGRALMFACFVFCTLFAALSLRSRRKTVLESRLHGNRQLLACCALVLLLQLAITQLAGLSRLFQMQPVPYVELVYVFLYASIVLVLMDGAKLFVRFLDYARRLLLKLAHNFTLPHQPARQQTYSAAAVAKSGRFADNSDYLAAIRPEPAQCTAVTPLAAPRTLFGNLMATPKLDGPPQRNMAASGRRPSNWITSDRSSPSP